MRRGLGSGLAQFIEGAHPGLPQAVSFGDIHVGELLADTGGGQGDLVPLLREDGCFQLFGGAAGPFPIQAKAVGLEPVAALFPWANRAVNGS